MTYTITFEDTTETIEIENSEYLYSDALAHVGYFLKTENQYDSSDIKDYTLVDVNGDFVWAFKEGFFENACLTALTELGYSVDEGDWIAFPETGFPESNIISFPRQ
jgi:hypothetical protein